MLVTGPFFARVARVGRSGPGISLRLIQASCSSTASLSGIVMDDNEEMWRLRHEMGDDLDDVDPIIDAEPDRYGEGEHVSKHAGYSCTDDPYPPGWKKRSRGYRQSRRFICERCGVDLSHPRHQEYLDTHHRDFDKNNNMDSNLRALCILCHSRFHPGYLRKFEAFQLALVEEARWRQGIVRPREEQ